MTKAVSRILGILIGGLIGYFAAQIYDLYWLVPTEKYLQDTMQDMVNATQNNPGLLTDVVVTELENLKYLRIVKVLILGIGLLLGYLSSGLLQHRLNRILTDLLDKLKRTSRERIIAGIAGFATGTVLTYIVLFPLYTFMKDAEVNYLQDPIVRIGIYLVFVTWLGFFGAYLAVNVFYPEAKADQLGAKFGIKGIPPKILDTSAIIDGRFAEVVKTHFMEGVLVVPASVLRELQAIADSSDHLRRAKGRRGLEILNDIRNNPHWPITIYDDSDEEALSSSVDEQIIRVARNLGGIVVTNDFNLNKVATVQGVEVLNINELANALKPMVIPNEELQVLVIKPGKEQGQGVGYLDDGTMVVVDGGSEYIGLLITVRVTSVMQTAAGRLIFARKSENHKETA